VRAAKAAMRLHARTHTHLQRGGLHVFFSSVCCACAVDKRRNSFATPFFLPLRDVAAALAAPPGRLVIDAAEAEALLKRELRCHRCGGAAANMPRLKEHLAACAAPLPDDDAGAGGGGGGGGAAQDE
jgi:hypothetical protein